MNTAALMPSKAKLASRRRLLLRRSMGRPKKIRPPETPEERRKRENEERYQRRNRQKERETLEEQNKMSWVALVNLNRKYLRQDDPEEYNRMVGVENAREDLLWQVNTLIEGFARNMQPGEGLDKEDGPLMFCSEEFEPVYRALQAWIAEHGVVQYPVDYEMDAIRKDYPERLAELQKKYPLFVKFGHEDAIPVHHPDSLLQTLGRSILQYALQHENDLSISMSFTAELYESFCSDIFALVGNNFEKFYLLMSGMPLGKLCLQAKGITPFVEPELGEGLDPNLQRPLRSQNSEDDGAYLLARQVWVEEEKIARARERVRRINTAKMLFLTRPWPQKF
jgi:hypothetical protein